MALGARERLKTDFSLSVSGIAGPDGGTEEKPVGTVWIALASEKGVIAKLFHFGEHRERNIRRSALAALNMLREELI
jgi:nicotinamide-nucleotide amidase